MKKKQFMFLFLLIFPTLVLSTFIVVKDNKLFEFRSEEDNFEVRTFILLGDAGDGSPGQIEVANSIVKYCESMDCEGVFYAGDVIYQNGVLSIDDPLFKSRFEDIYKNVNTPFYIAFGNHDYRGCKDCYLQYTNLSTKWEMPFYYYKIDIDPDLDFFVVDTNDYNTAQDAWFKEQLKASTKKFKIVMGHKPLIPGDTLHQNDDTTIGKIGLFRKLICQNANLYLAGDSHVASITSKIPDCALTQIISGNGSDNLRPVNQRFAWDFAGSYKGFVAIEKHERYLKLKFLDSSLVTKYEQILNF